MRKLIPIATQPTSGNWGLTHVMELFKHILRVEYVTARVSGPRLKWLQNNDDLS